MKSRVSSFSILRRNSHKKKTTALILNLDKEKSLASNVDSILQSLLMIQSSFLLLARPNYEISDIAQIEQLMVQHQETLNNYRIKILSTLQLIDDSAAISKSFVYQIAVRLIRRISMFKEKLAGMGMRVDCLNEWKSTLIQIQESQLFNAKYNIRELVQSVFGNYYKFVNCSCRKITEQIRKLKESQFATPQDLPQRRPLTQISIEFLKNYEENLRVNHTKEQEIEHGFVRSLYITTISQQANSEILYRQAKGRNKRVLKERKLYAEQYQKFAKKHEKRKARSMGKDNRVLNTIIILRNGSEDKSLATKSTEDSLPRLNQFKTTILVRRPSRRLRIL